MQAWRVAEDEPVDAVLQIALIEVVRAQASGAVHVQRSQRFRQQRAHILINDLHGATEPLDQLSSQAKPPRGLLPMDRRLHVPEEPVR